MKLLYLTNIPSPYIVDYFNELGKLCELKVIFEKHKSSERDNSWENYHFVNFKGIILKGISMAVDTAFCPQIIKYLKPNQYDYIIICNPTTPTGIIAIEYMKLAKIPYILESEGGIPKNGKGIKEKFKKQIMSNAKLYFSTTPKADEYFLAYGATINKLRKYPFTSLFAKEILDIPITREKKAIRDQLKLKGQKIAVAVGSFIPRKNYGILIKAWRNVSEEYHLYIIGGGEEKQKYEKMMLEYNLKNIDLVEFIPKDLIFQYYKAADLFIHPTNEDIWGLVINEAMACALPVITTNMCIAGIELVTNGENGYIVPVNDERALTEKINHILVNDNLRTKMSENSLAKIQWYTFESMAQTHIDVLSDLEDC